MRRQRPFQFLTVILLLVQSFGIILCTPFAAGTNQIDVGPTQSGLIRVALTKNVAPRSDWRKGIHPHTKRKGK